MFDKYARQGLHTGKTVSYEVTELRNPDGSHPIVHLEHLGAANKTLMQALIARAKASEEGEAVDDRELLARHAVRHLENVFLDDGTAASEESIPAFVAALPFLAVLRMVRFVSEDANYCEYPIADDPKAIAEK